MNLKSYELRSHINGLAKDYGNMTANALEWPVLSQAIDIV